MGVLGPISPISVTTPSALPPLPQISYSDALQLPNLTLPGINGSSGVNQTGNVSQATALSTPTQPGGAPSASVLQQAAALFSALGPGVAKGASSQASAGVSTLFGLSIGRIAAFALGLILIAGGIFLFGRQPITQVAATAARAAVAV